LLPDKKWKNPYFSNPYDDNKEIQEFDAASSPTFKDKKSAESTKDF